MRFNEQVIWITGASSGIGKALAQKLAARGARLILTARNEPALHELARNAGQEYCVVLPADLKNLEVLDSLCTQAIQAFGHIDCVIHSAGVTQRSMAEDTDQEVLRELMDINFFAPVVISQCMLPHFRKRGSGHIVAISSMAGLMGFPKRSGYAAAKHALKGYFETLQTEHTLPDFGITLVFPGRINTPISISALTAHGAPHKKMDVGQQRGIPANICADKIIYALEKGKRRVIIAGKERVLWALWFYWPSLYYRFARKIGLDT